MCLIKQDNVTVRVEYIPMQGVRFGEKCAYRFAIEHTLGCKPVWAQRRMSSMPNCHD